MILDYNGSTSPATSLRGALLATTVKDTAPFDTGVGVGYFDDGAKVTARATYVGDANLDGNVNALDFNALATSFGTGQFWQEGDFNYDGVVNTNDFNALAGNFNRSTVLSAPALGAPPALGALVPEPASACGIALSGLLLARRKRGWKTAEINVALLPKAGRIEGVRS